MESLTINFGSKFHISAKVFTVPALQSYCKPVPANLSPKVVLFFDKIFCNFAHVILSFERSFTWLTFSKFVLLPVSWPISGLH